jgi:Red chlorophyll catabolite reductase (RCC reductase)
MTTDTKTIDQFLADNPDVDVSQAWERCWGILSDIKERIAARFPGLSLEPNCEDRAYYTSPNGEFEGSMQAWSGPGCDWLVNSWLGNRKASILDMNATAFLGQETDVPHFVMVFGTIPKLFFYFDFTPRRNLMVDTAYLDRYYGVINEEYLALRGNPAFQWSVSHGTYMRALTNPSTQSLMGDLNDDNISLLEDYAHRMLEHWLGWLEQAPAIPQPQRGALRDYDFKVRELGYARDPMNKLAVQVFGADQVENMLNIRMGREQMQRALQGQA